MSLIDFPILYIPDSIQGRPLFYGQIFVGEPDLDPEIPANQKQLNIMQENGTLVPVNQPFTLSAGGVPMYNGADVRLDVDGNYSLKILDKNGGQQCYIHNAYDGHPVIDEILINDLSQAYIFDTVAEYKAFATEFPVGKTIHLNDRSADFTVIAGTGTGNDKEIIASSQVNQSIEMQNVSDVRGFENKAELIAAYLIPGQTATTQYALTEDDNGGATYKIGEGVNPDNSLNPTLNNGFFAELLIGDNLIIQQYGVTTESDIASALSDSKITKLDFDFDNATNPVRSFIITNRPDYRNFRINGAHLYSDKISGTMAIVPDDFPIRPLFSAKCVGVGTVATDFDIRTYDIALNTISSDVKTYYVDPVNGTQGGDGTEGDPLDTLARVGLREDLTPSSEPVLNIIAKPYKYDQSSVMAAGVAGLLKSYSLVRWGDTGSIKQLQGRWGDNQSWADLTGGVWSTSLSNCTAVFDEMIKNDLGDSSFYTKVESDIENVAGTWFQDGSTIKIHTIDGREPDIDIGIGRMIASSLINSSVTDATVYCEDVEFLGGTKAMQLDVAAASSSINWISNRCKYMYGQTNGQQAEGHALIINQNCVGAYNGSDGFNYHSNSSDLTSESVSIEVNCKGYRNGYTWSATQNINNGSTAHDKCLMLRYGTIAFENQGPNIVDVNDAYSYNFACHAQDSLRAKPHPDCADFDFATAGGSVGCFAWMQCCTTELGSSEYSITSTAESVKLLNCNVHPSINGVPSITPY